MCTFIICVFNGYSCDLNVHIWYVQATFLLPIWDNRASLVWEAIGEHRFIDLLYYHADNTTHDIKRKQLMIKYN